MNVSDINSLKYLIMLVDEGSVSKVAQKANLSQPAISLILKKLREIFNDPIVVKSKGKMIPTPRGEWLANECRTIINNINHLQHSTAIFDHRNYEGKFVISAPEYVDNSLTPEIYKLLSYSNSSATLHIKPPNPLIAESELSSGAIDLRIGWVDQINLNTRSKFLYNESFLCIVNKNHPLIHKTLTLEKFCQMPHVRHQASVPSTASRAIDHEINKIRKKILNPIIVPSMLTLGRLVSQTNVISCLPFSLAKFLASIYPLEVFNPPVSLPILKVAMYWHEKMQNDKRHSWLRKLVSEASKQININIERKK